jgi:hypothetical protein
MKVTIIGYSEMNKDKEKYSGVIYLKSVDEKSSSYLRRDWDKDEDLRVSDYGKGEFSIIKTTTKYYTMSELRVLGFTQSNENEFNNYFLDAVSWILYNTPAHKAKRPRKKVVKD